MIEKTFKFIDYDGNEREEVHYFNLSDAERLEMEMSTDGGLTKMINKMIADQNGTEIMRLFKQLILKSYGVKSPDGRRFMKSEQISKGFSETEAYNQLVMELITDAKAAGAFVEGLAGNNTYKVNDNKPQKYYDKNAHSHKGNKTGGDA